MKISPKELSAGALAAESLRLALRTFRDAGYVVLEDAYDLKFLRKVREAYEAELEAYLRKQGGLEKMEGRTFGKNHIGYFPRIVPPMSDPLLVAHPIAVQLMDALLGEHFQCGFYNTNTAMPGSGIQPIHRDSPSMFGTEMAVPHPVTSLVLNIPLCDFSVENGSTEIWPGSHLIVDTDPGDKDRLIERAETLASTRANLKLGSFALRDLRLWHRGMPNRAASPRTMIALVYERGYFRTGTLRIPRATWEGWDERTRRIFRHNEVIEEAEAGKSEMEKEESAA
jgi:ectoine hydroxylase-related dioxygenase (phytanoyl-CoA dioxygenase family)